MPPSELAERKNGRPPEYDRPTIERALTELALANGSSTRAARRLAQRGINVPESNLRYWITGPHATLYEEIKAEVLPRVREVIAEESEELAVAYAEAEREILTDLLEHKGKLDAKDMAGAIRNLATSRGISVDKAQLLRGQPTAITHTADAEELLRSLKDLTVEGTCEDVTEASRP